MANFIWRRMDETLCDWNSPRYLANHDLHTNVQHATWAACDLLVEELECLRDNNSAELTPQLKKYIVNRIITIGALKKEQS